MAFARFERDRGEAPLSDINMTPLIDVMLVLLVILLLTAPLLDGRIALQLPRVDAAAGAAAVDLPVLSLQRDGRIDLDGRSLTDSQLPAALRALAASPTHRGLRIRADAAVPYGEVARVMAAAQAAGLTSLDLMTRPAALPAGRAATSRRGAPAAASPRSVGGH